MDPVTTAILAALGTGAAKVAGKAVEDAYSALKGVIKRKFGEESEISQAIKKLEANPESVGRKTTLQEEVASANANKDHEVLEAAEVLLAEIKVQPSGEEYIQTAIGNYNAQAGKNSTATVNVNRPNE